MEIFKIAREHCTYTSCYCEENVWKLCQKIKDGSSMDLSQFYVVFISNSEKKIPLWCQKSSSYPMAQPVVWDYHVLLIHDKGKDSLVYDLDTTLNFPCCLLEYAVKAIRNEETFKKDFCRMFRVIPATTYLEVFASDRSHMLTSDGRWISPPPDYPPISSQDCTMNLFVFIDMTRSEAPGNLLDLDSFLKHFHVKCTE